MCKDCSRMALVIARATANSTGVASVSVFIVHVHQEPVEVGVFVVANKIEMISIAGCTPVPCGVRFCVCVCH